jgi:hypothetical protein
VRKSIACLAFILASAVAWAQDRPSQQDQMLNRLRERLGLTEEQFEKVKQIYTTTRESEEKIQKEREEKVKELLNDDQKKQYDEFRRNPWGGRAPGGMGGMGAQWLERMLPQIDSLKTELNLSDEQAEKIKVHLEEFAAKARERVAEMQANGFQGMNWQEEMQKFQERIKELTEKVKTHLNDEQKAQLDKLVENRFQNMGRGPGGPGGREGGRPPRPSVEDRLRRVMETLRIEQAEEAAAVRGLVKAVVEAQYALEDAEREARTKIDEMARKTDLTEDEIKVKVDELRGVRREKDKTVRDAQKSLSEVVTYRQELELIRAGILR